ncbi:hypothetical protein RB595_000951 [Gaeumannomyces hyphopodioides]
MDHDLVFVDEFDALAIEVKGSKCAPVLSADEKYPAKTHARKVAKELNVQSGLLYLPGLPTQHYEDSDMGPAFRQRRYFFYLTGSTVPDAAVTYDIATDNLILWVPYREPRQELYYGKIPSKEECLAKSDIDDCRYVASIERFISKHLSNTGAVLYLLHDTQTPHLEHHRGRITLNTQALLPAMDRARVVKTPYEVRQIRKASAVSSAAHKLVLARLRNFRSEADVEATYLASCISNGSQQQAYAVIAGSGPNAATLHYDANNESLEGRQVIVFDAGAEWNCYASDITRTLPIGGSFTPEASQIYAIVDAMQRAAIQKVKPGVPYRELHLTAQMAAVTGLLRLGILSGGSAREIFASGVVSALFPHGLGHHVGLEVHDVLSDRLMGHGPSSLRKIGKRTLIPPEFCAAMIRNGSDGKHTWDEVGKLAENMIVTIEPGIYFNREYIKAFAEDEPTRAKFINFGVLERYWAVGGVRIEDMILVKSDGYEIISSAPKGEEALRIINSR